MTNQPPKRIATQLPVSYNNRFQARLPETELLQVPVSTNFTLPDDIEIFLAAPYCRAGGTLPTEPPKGWPFNLKWVQLISVGIDLYPEWMFQGPVVTTLHGTSANALAEFALAAIFAQAKRLPELWINDADAWKNRGMSDVSGSTLGIFGYGTIARAIIPKAQALGMDINCCRKSDKPFNEPHVNRADSVESLLAESDHVLLAAPATSDTARIINADTLSGAKPGLHLINLARGSLVDDKALLQALEDNRLSRATLDVSHPEPLPAGHPFYSHPKVFLSPHNGVMTPQTMANTTAMFVDNLERFINNKPLRAVVEN